MKFSDKVKNARNKAGMTQVELAKALGVSLRTITNYETGDRYPKKRETYKILADVLKVDMNYLFTENEEFAVQAHEQYGKSGGEQAEELLAQMGGLFAGGKLSEADMDGVMRAIQDLYWRAKEENKKYAKKSVAE